MKQNSTYTLGLLGATTLLTAVGCDTPFCALVGFYDDW